jgi:hypothetical protein
MWWKGKGNQKGLSMGVDNGVYTGHWAFWLGRSGILYVRSSHEG